MNAASIAVVVLLTIGVAIELACCVGVLVMDDAYDKLHYVGPAAIVGPLVIAAAIVVRASLSQAGIKALLTAGLLMVTSPVLSHATARALYSAGATASSRSSRSAVTVLQVTILLLVAAGGTSVVATRDPLRQAMVASFFGILLALLFFVLQAPDVALSEIVVGAVALPLMILLSLAKIRGGEK